MLIKKTDDFRSSEITDPALFATRRRFLQGSAASLLAGGLSLPALAAAERGQRLPNVVKSKWTVDDKQTPYESLTTYNNFYEFGPDKGDPAKNAHRLKTSPWTVTVEGEVRQPKTFGIDDILKWAPLEERVYAFRCVEGWSMVVPWVGFSLSEIAKRVEVTSNAKFVEFISLADAEQMPYVRTPLLNWPYNEGLRIDEAMHPLTMLAVGVYGEVLPKQNGAPIRLVVPWKYGFKNAKSIVKIRFVRDMPRSSWMKSGPQEYGFYSNVNPDVPHPRWSQAQERRLGDFLKRKTLIFNGYADQVGSMYAGMDLKKNF